MLWFVCQWRKGPINLRARCHSMVMERTAGRELFCQFSQYSPYSFLPFASGSLGKRNFLPLSSLDSSRKRLPGHSLARHFRVAIFPPGDESFAARLTFPDDWTGAVYGVCRSPGPLYCCGVCFIDRRGVLEVDEAIARTLQ